MSKTKKLTRAQRREIFLAARAAAAAKDHAEATRLFARVGVSYCYDDDARGELAYN